MPSTPCAEHTDLIRLSTETHTNVEILLLEVRALRVRVNCLERRWWKSLGVVLGICGFITLLGTSVGIYTATKRFESDYIRKDVVPIEVLVEHSNKRANVSP